MDTNKGKPTGEVQRASLLKGKSTDDEEMTLLDFAKVIVNQKKMFGLFSALIFIPGLIYIFFMPKIYIAQSSILLEREGMYAASSDGGSQDVLNLRMHAIIKTILSTRSIKEILNDNEVINNDSTKVDIASSISSFRNAANFEFDNVSVLRENTGREGLYSMGLSVSFESDSPEYSYEMTKELTNRLLGNNDGKLSEESSLRLDFLQSKLAVVTTKLEATEASIATFKESNALSLPEMQGSVVRSMDDLRYRMVQSDDRLRMLRDRADENDAQLASISVDSTIFSTEGARIVSAQDQLEILLLEYATIKDKYSVTHPDRVEMEEKISALRAHVGTGSEEGMEIDLKLARQELAALKNRYFANHPDVLSANEKVIYIEKQLAAGKNRGRKKTGATTNPIYNNLLSRQRGLTGEIRLEQTARNNLNTELRNIEQRMQKMPDVDRQIRRLESKRDRVEERYNNIEDEITKLTSDSDMQEADLFERFILLEAPDIPLLPSKPNKKVLIPLLFLFSLGFAYLAVFIRQFAQAKIYGSEDVEKVTDLPIYLIPDFS